MSDLTSAIAAKPIAALRRDYETQLRDWADTDTAVRKACDGILTDHEINGDSYGVPTIEDIVERLCAKIRDYRKRCPNLDETAVMDIEPAAP